ncbi:MAG TPA: DUF805 domain-containing protein [Gallionellaceae bacterium]
MIWKQRIGAGTYLLTMSSAMIAWSLATLYLSDKAAVPKAISLGEYNFYVSLFGAAVGGVFWLFSAGRLRDLNMPGWVVNLLAFPLIGVVILPVMCFLSGPRWKNDYGDPPQPSGILKVCVSLALFGFAIVCSYDALNEYYKVRYLLALGG